jgi:hypothetical protein
MQYSSIVRPAREFYCRRFPQINADETSGVAKRRDLVIRLRSREFAANKNNQSGKL